MSQQFRRSNHQSMAFLWHAAFLVAQCDHLSPVLCRIGVPAHCLQSACACALSGAVSSPFNPSCAELACLTGCYNNVFWERVSLSEHSGCDALQLSQLALEGPKKVREREQRFGGRGFVAYGHNQDNSDDNDEIESVKGVRRRCVWPCTVVLLLHCVHLRGSPSSHLRRSLCLHACVASLRCDMSPPPAIHSFQESGELRGMRMKSSLSGNVPWVPRGVLNLIW